MKGNPECREIEPKIPPENIASEAGGAAVDLGTITAASKICGPRQILTFQLLRKFRHLDFVHNNASQVRRFVITSVRGGKMAMLFRSYAPSWLLRGFV